MKEEKPLFELLGDLIKLCKEEDYYFKSSHIKELKDKIESLVIEKSDLINYIEENKIWIDKEHEEECYLIADKLSYDFNLTNNRI